MATQEELEAELTRLNDALAEMDALPEAVKQTTTAALKKQIKDTKEQIAQINVQASDKSVGVGGDNYAPITINAMPETPTTKPALREAYLNFLIKENSRLSLNGVDPSTKLKKADEESANDRMALNAVYVALMTKKAEQKEVGFEPRAEATRHLSALEQLNQHKYLVLQGEPGSGKSTFVRYVTLCLCGESLGYQEMNLQTLTMPLPDENGESTEDSQPWEHKTLLPLPIILRDYAANLPPAGQNVDAQHIWSFVEEQIKQKEGFLSDYLDDLKKELLNKGGLILLDGLDEVPDSNQQRDQVKQAVESLASVFRKCRFLVTCRTYAYQNQQWRLNGFDDAILDSLTDGQINRFVDRWYVHAVELDKFSETHAKGRAQQLKQAIFSVHPGSPYLI